MRFINLDHGLELYGPETFPIPEHLAALASNPTIIACPGSTTCTKGLVNCWAAADEIRQVLTGQHLQEVRINISGCPNNCAHGAVSDIGLVGLLQKRNGKLAESYRLFRGGGNGRNDKPAKQSEIIYAQDIAAAVKRLLEPAKSDEDQNQRLFFPYP